jgi:hypothetical protein
MFGLLACAIDYIIKHEMQYSVPLFRRLGQSLVPDTQYSLPVNTVSPYPSAREE